MQQVSQMVQFKTLSDISALPIHRPCLSTKQIEKGCTFVALQGAKTDGRAFIKEACAKGAAIVIYQHSSTWAREVEQAKALYPQVVFVPLEDAPKHFFPAILQAAYGDNLPKSLIAVTGTNGKTSVAYFTYQLAKAFGPAAYLGTTGIETSIPGLAQTIALPSLTTPDVFSIYAALHTLKQAGVETISLEASSHGLELGRLEGLFFKAAAFTNLTPEHLDFHASMDAYFEAKLKLFTEHVTPDSIAVINTNDSWGRKIYASLNQSIPVKTLGNNVGCDLQFLQIKPSSAGSVLTFSYLNKNYTLHLPFYGDFHGYNIASALLLAANVTGASVDDLIKLVPTLSPPPGRMECIGNTAKGAGVFIDYAHTPDALETAIRSLKAHTAGQLWAVFGCGGDRDKKKRPLMGKICQDHADQCIVTDDNPRTEDAAQIRASIIEACPKAFNIAPREASIKKALDKAAKGDTILIAGKGHETGQIIGTKTIPYSDHEVVRRLLGEGTQVDDRPLAQQPLA